MGNEKLNVLVLKESELASIDIKKTIYDLDNQIAMLSSNADNLDYFVAVSSGIICAVLDIVWVGEFDLKRGREISSEQADEFVKKTARLLGCKKEGTKDCVAFLEEMFPLASDGNTSEFGGGLQHHLRDFAHHPTIVGLVFSMLTQFTGMSYGTDENGVFKVCSVKETHFKYIGDSVEEKIVRGLFYWFGHLISDVAGSSLTAGLSGGTGIPGPILSLAKEISVLPCFKDAKIDDMSLSKYLSKVFNGTIFAKRDASNKIVKESVIKLDLRGELGVVNELGRQAVPVIANECIVRSFYFIRRFASAIKTSSIKSIGDIKNLDWEAMKPFGNPIVDRMITISTGVFTGIDIAEAIITEKYFVSVNLVGVGRFTVAIGKELVNYFNVRNVILIKKMYEEIDRNTYTCDDYQLFMKKEKLMNIEKLGLTVEQTEILYNLEMYKTINDINITNVPVIKDKLKSLKSEWLEEWKGYMAMGFSSFVQNENATLNWYTKEQLLEKIRENNCKEVWFRLVLLEAMLFEPYYTISLEKDKEGNDIPSKKYNSLHVSVNGYSKTAGDMFLDEFFPRDMYREGYVKRLRKCYNKVMMELNEVVKSAVKGLAITAVIALAVAIAAGTFAPAIAVTLVGSNFAGLSGAALTSACLAYLGGGAIAVGGLGMAGGTAAIVGGGALLGLGVGTAAGGTAKAISILGKKNTILQSIKLMVSVREIFLNDEHDLEYANSVYEQYVEQIENVQKHLVELKIKENIAEKNEKKKLKLEIKNTKESVDVMMIAMKSMYRFLKSFEIGVENTER